MPPKPGLMPNPWPAVSPLQRNRTSPRARPRVRPSAASGAGGTTKRPATGSLIARSLSRPWKATRTKTSRPGSRPVRSCRAVKSVVSSAWGPTMRCDCLNVSSYDHSTSMRAGRSLRLQTTTAPSLGSPNCRPCSACGRSAADTTMAGARLNTSRRQPPRRPSGIDAASGY